MSTGAVTGLLLVDKPVGPTSHDVVARVRRAFGIRRVGHSGTLDPTASGLLVVGLGTATRLLGHLGDLPKQYLATIRLGATTTTDDAAGDIVLAAGAAGLAIDRVVSALPSFTGVINQRPSTVSAVHVGGRRAHELAREGIEVELPERSVTVHRFEIEGVRSERVGELEVLDVDVVVTVSTGTYVRALARDLGQLLGTGGHLTSLRRTRIGPFEVADAVALDPEPTVADIIAPGEALAGLFPTLVAADEDADRVRHGVRLATLLADGERLAVTDTAGALLAIATVRGGWLAYDVVLAGD